MAKTITVNAVMEQLKMAGNEQSANRAVLRKCSVDFLEEMAEVVSQQSSCFFWRLPMKGRKKYYLDKLAQVRVEDLPIAKLERDKEACLSWLQGREGKGKFTNEWISYLQDQKSEEAVTMTQVFAVGQKFRIANRGEWEVVTRTKCFVTFSNGSATERCKVYMGDGVEYVHIPHRDVLGRKDSVCAKDAIESEQPQPCFTCINVEGELKVVTIFPDAVCDPEQLSAQNDVVKFEVGKTYSGFRANSQPETYRIVARNEQWVYYRDIANNQLRCRRIKITTDKTGRVCERLCTCGGGQATHLSRYIYASSIEEAAQMMTVSAYDIGKQIVSLKGKAKAQQALVKSCGEKFLLAMMDVFTRPVRVTMNTPDELTKWMCRGVLTAIRNPEYAKSRLSWVSAMVKRNSGEEKAYLKGWEEFLKEYAPKEPEISEKDKKLQELRIEIRGICTTRYWLRVQLRVGMGAEVAARYAQETARGKELLKQYMELKHSSEEVF